MRLFEETWDSSVNRLPYDGEVYYHGPLMEDAKAWEYFHALHKGIAWAQDEALMFGKLIQTDRKVAWYGDEAFEYRYSNRSKRALAWTSELLELKTWAEKHSGHGYNSCLLNLYHSGSEGMAWHSDGEKDLKKEGAIASISLGVERSFSFKHKNSKERISFPLAHGSLLVMQGKTQTHWLHRLPPSKKVEGARINLTFRTIEKR